MAYRGKRHYQQVAQVLAAEIGLYGPDGQTPIVNVALSLADVYAAESDTFDREKFYEAAGVYAVRPELRGGE